MKELTEKYVEKPKKAMFDGYVEKSTNERTKMSDLAIDSLFSNPFVVFFGALVPGLERQFEFKLPDSE